MPDDVQRFAAALNQPRNVSIQLRELLFTDLSRLIVAEAKQSNSLRRVAIAASEKHVITFNG